MPSFIEKLALAFLEYKNTTKLARGDSNHASGSLSSTLPSVNEQSQTSSDATSSGLPSKQAQDVSVGRCTDPLLAASAKFKKDSLATYLDWLNVQKPESRLIKSIPTLTDALLLLRCEHWLEAADEAHRYGSNLRPYFDYWVANVNNRIEEGDEEDEQSMSSDAWLDKMMNDGRGSQLQHDDAGAAAARAGVADAHPAAGGEAATGGGAAAVGGSAHATGVSALDRGAWPAASAGSRAKHGAAASIAGATAKDKSKEPAGGWQKVLEAVAASTILHRRSAGKNRVPFSVPLSRKSSFATLSAGSASRARSVLVRTRSGREVASAPVTPKVLSRNPSGRAHAGVPASHAGTPPSHEEVDDDETLHCGGTTPQDDGLPVLSVSPMGRPGVGCLLQQSLAMASPLFSEQLEARRDWGGVGDEEAEGGPCVASGGEQEEVGWGLETAGSLGQQQQQQQQKRWMLQCKSLRLVAAAADDGDGRDGLVGDSDEDDEDGGFGGPLNLGSIDEIEEGLFDLHEDQDRHNFFLWLDKGEGKTLDLAAQGVPRDKLERDRVRYLTQEELPHYEVVVDKDTGLLKYSLSGCILHTFGPGKEKDAEKDGSKAKAVDAGNEQDQEAVQAAAAGDAEAVSAGAAEAAAAPEAHAADGGGDVASAGPAPAAPPFPIPDHHGAKKWIWVVAPSGKLYVAPKIRGAFHHSSFLRGAVVMAAGNMAVDHGKLVKLTADSGHYWPQPDHFRWFFEHLSAQGADMTALEGMEFRTKH